MNDTAVTGRTKRLLGGRRATRAARPIAFPTCHCSVIHGRVRLGPGRVGLGAGNASCFLTAVSWPVGSGQDLPSETNRGSTEMLARDWDRAARERKHRGGTDPNISCQDLPSGVSYQDLPSVVNSSYYIFPLHLPITPTVPYTFKDFPRCPLFYSRSSEMYRVLYCRRSCAGISWTLGLSSGIIPITPIISLLIPLAPALQAYIFQDNNF